MSGMKDLNLSVARSGRPHYLRIADALRTAIQDGRVRAGEAVPSSRLLADELGAHRQTVMAALGELVAEGWLTARERHSYRVSATLPSRFFQPLAASSTVIPAGEKTPAPAVFAWDYARSPELAPPADAAAYTYPFFSGTPDLRLFPAAEFRGFIAGALRQHPERVLGYSDPAGHPPFLKELGVYLRRMRALQGRELVVTNGSQEALFLLAQLLVAPGDRVGVEAQGYRPAWDALRAAGATLVALPIDADGLDADAAAAAMARTKLKMIYTTPLHQYPTTVTIPVGRRARLYDACVRHGVPLLEDDYDHEFHYRCQPLPPLAAHDPAGIVLYVSTFSKILFPGARLGFAALPPPVAQRFAALKKITTRQNDLVLQDAVARWMRDGGFERHLRRMRRVYAERRDAMLGALARLRAQGLPLAWTEPDGGMAVWVDVGCAADAVVASAKERGVYAAPGSHYRSGGRGVARHLRLGFANQTPRELELGMKRLGEAIATHVR